jgi:hypothetical protein
LLVFKRRRGKVTPSSLLKTPQQHNNPKGSLPSSFFVLSFINQAREQAVTVVRVSLAPFWEY